jgi:hypothetical protein
LLRRAAFLPCSPIIRSRVIDVQEHPAGRREAMPGLVEKILVTSVRSCAVAYGQLLSVMSRDHVVDALQGPRFAGNDIAFVAHPPD